MARAGSVRHLWAHTSQGKRWVEAPTGPLGTGSLLLARMTSLVPGLPYQSSLTGPSHLCSVAVRMVGSRSVALRPQPGKNYLGILPSCVLSPRAGSQMHWREPMARHAKAWSEGSKLGPGLPPS